MLLSVEANKMFNKLSQLKVSMEEKDIERISINSEKLKQWAAQFKSRRCLYDEIAGVSQEFYVGIKGVRGIGKTTMMLQLCKETTNSVYLSADATYLRHYSIYEIADALRKKGFKTIFIDEIHTRQGWAEDLKTIYDEHAVRVFFSGSSSINLKNTGADLSRRAVVYSLEPVSFREYLNIRKGMDIPAYSLKQILENAGPLSRKYLPAKEWMEEYMRFGGVFYSGKGFQKALENSLEKVITKDLLALRDINLKYEEDAYRLLYHVAISPPFETSFSSIASKLGISKAFAIRLVSDLESAGLLKSVYPCTTAGRNVKKEPKIYLTIPIRALLAYPLNKGSAREEFFVNHVFPECYFKTEKGQKTADFRTGEFKIEVGGTSKDFSQNPDYIAVDGGLAEGKKVPLFLFGFLY